MDGLLIIYKKHLGAIHTYPLLFQNGDFSLQFGLNCPHISNKNGQWKCIFSKTLSREKIFKTPFAVLWDLSDGWKWRLLETIMSPCWILVNQCTLPLRVCGTVFNHYCFFVWMRKKDLKMQHAYQSRFFFGEQTLKPKWIFFF